MKLLLPFVSFWVATTAFANVPRPALGHRIQALRSKAYIGSGFKALTVCSGVFVSGRPAGHVLSRDFAGYDPNLSRIKTFVDYGNRCVTTEIMPFRKIYRTACYRERFGCALTDYGSGDHRPVAAMKGLSVPTQPYSSLNWDTDGKSVESVDYRALDAATRFAFQRRDQNTRAIVVLHKGKIVGERYAPGITQDMPLKGWSMSKSVTSALVGVLVDDGKLSLDSAHLFQAWEKDGRSAITLRQLLQMSSGLSFTEVYANPFSDVSRMLFTSPNYAGYAVNRPLQHAPGTQWTYSSGTTALLQAIIRNQFGTHEEYLRFIYDRLIYKIGMTSAVFETDASGTFVGAANLYASARDWTRFGWLFLNQGKWGSESILSPEWTRFSVEPASARRQGDYGAQWWLNRGDGQTRPWRDLPSDAFAAKGFEGQNIVIVPSKDLVIVRLGKSVPGTGRQDFEGTWDLNAFAGKVAAAIK